MKGAFRKSMNWLHTWTGLALGWLLFLVFLTGTAGYFDTEIDRWMQPELPSSAQTVPEAELVEMALGHLEENAAWSTRWQITLPTGRDEALGIAWKKPATDKPRGHGRSMQRELINHETDQIAEPRDTAGGQGLYRLHYRLHYMPAIVAFWLIGLASMFMLLAIVTGIVIHIKIFKDFFTFRPKEGPRSWLDAHSVVSVLALPFHLMITYSGLAFFIFTFMSIVFIANYDKSEMKNIRSEAFPQMAPFEASGEPAELTNLMPVIAEAKRLFGDDDVYRITIDHPMDKNAVISIRRHDTGLMQRHDDDRLLFSGTTGERLNLTAPEKPVASEARSVLLGLHEGQFAGIFMRWLYFLAGLLGTAMIATGLLLWVEKRRFKYENKQAPTRGYLLVQRLNAGMIVGLPLAIAAYFIGNRLLPVELVERGAWELNVLFLTLGLAMLYPFMRPPKKVWIEMLSITALAYLLVPVINAMTSQHHIVATFIKGDWTLFTFDFSMLLFSGMMAAAAYYLFKRRNEMPQKSSGKKSRRKGATAVPKNTVSPEAVATRQASPAPQTAFGTASKVAAARAAAMQRSKTRHSMTHT